MTTTPSPTSFVTAMLTLMSTDSNTNVLSLNKAMPSLNSKALQVQYMGYVQVPGNPLSFTILPIATLANSAFAVVFVRNLGGQGGNILVSTQTPGASLLSTVNLDVGGMFLYISPALAGVQVAGITAGISELQLTTTSSLTNGSAAEVLVAG